MKFIKYLIIIFGILSITKFSFADDKKNTGVFVDNGIMKWKDSGEEVRLFGINYTVPFAYAYRAHKRLGLSLQKSIDIDVNHFARLGFDAFRVHMWDREISDRNGNVLNNEHLELFDYLLYKLSQKGIKTIITPIAWWGTAWPEPDYETPGFSSFYSKVEMITNKEAWKAQKNYLKQIINHINPYNGLAYKDDPSIIALEIINEPHHPEDTSLVRQYINELYDALRDAGFTKPIFYNISESWDDAQAQAVCNSKAEGVSFQWYPTGLVHNKMLEGNYLINVNKYKIPSEKVNGFNKKAKMVYEFDAADIGASFMYPAMARSFREAGMQFATMFAYDPVQIAWSNTEYQTHFVNLLYAPSKAISLMIASKVFHEVPLSKNFGDFPNNNLFENFRIDYGNNLSEYNSPTEFIYSNSTNSTPKFVDSLIRIVGIGNSSVIQYDGTGAYFLDKIENGLWRLEVYPDVLWLKDPFEQTSMKKQIAKLFWNERKMKISIPEIGENFRVVSLSHKLKTFYSKGNEIEVTPGIYLISSKNTPMNHIKKFITKEKFLEGLYSPENNDIAFVINNTPFYISLNDESKIRFQIASDKKIDEAFLFVRRPDWRRFEKHLLKKVDGFNYALADSIKLLYEGEIEFCVAVKIDNKIYTFPDGKNISPDDWDFYYEKIWKTKIINNNTPIELFNAARDYKDLVFPQFTKSTRFVVDNRNGLTSERNSIFVNVTSTGQDNFPFGFQLNVSKIIKSIKNNLFNYRTIILNARTLSDSSLTLGINLITSDGKCFQSKVKLENNWGKKSISIDEFQKGSCLILPFSYPRFLPKIWNSNIQTEKEKIKLEDLEFIQFFIENPGKAFNNSLEIESLILK